MDEKKRILCIDDEPLVAQLCKHVLTTEGYEVQTARTGESALELLESIPFDVMLIDLRLPGINGWDTFRAARRRFSDVCAVLITGYGSKETVIAALKAGFDDFLDKPFTSDQLVLVVQQVIERKRERAALAHAHRVLEVERDFLKTLVSAELRPQVSEGLLIAAASVPGVVAAILFAAGEDGFRALAAKGVTTATALLAAVDATALAGKGCLLLADTALSPFFPATHCTHVLVQEVAGTRPLLLAVAAEGPGSVSKSAHAALARMADLCGHALTRLNA